jgi:hypothetical protein
VSPASISSGGSSTLNTTTSFSGGTPTYLCQWLFKAPGAGSFSNLDGVYACTAPYLPTTSTGPLVASGTWEFMFEVTDNSATTPVTVFSNVVTVHVS